MKILGIDLGSRTVKLVLFNDNNLVANRIYDTAFFYRNYCTNSNNKLSVNFDSLGIGAFDKLVSTGYGRNNVNICNANIIVELKAHTFGVVWQTGLKDFTLLDIGGQDTKVILVRNGKMIDMILNDKCAASCGRYMENMANVLNLDLHELSKYYKNPVELSSTCAVFAESELIGKVSEGHSLEHLTVETLV